MSQDPNTATCTDGTIYASGAVPSQQGQRRLRAQGPGACRRARTSIGTKPTRAFKDDVVYEVHVRGLTKNDTSIAAALARHLRGRGAESGVPGQPRRHRGRVPAGAGDPERHQRRRPELDRRRQLLGLHDAELLRAGSPLFLRQDARAARPASGKAMVKAFHDAGIKVYIDVVYNHTGEGGAWGGSDGLTVYNLLSWRGLDNPTYYSLTSDLQYSWDNTGVGGNYNTRNTIAQNLIIDSLAYWRDTLGVDGFRFDLASVLGNTCQHGCFNFDKMDPGNALNRIVNELPPRPAGGGSGSST